MKDIGSVKSMPPCLVAYVKQFEEKRVRHICKMEKLRYTASEKWAAEVKRGERELSMMNRMAD